MSIPLSAKEENDLRQAFESFAIKNSEGTLDFLRSGALNRCYVFSTRLGGCSVVLFIALSLQNCKDAL